MHFNAQMYSSGFDIISASAEYLRPSCKHSDLDNVFDISILQPKSYLNNTIKISVHDIFKRINELKMLNIQKDLKKTYYLPYHNQNSLNLQHLHVFYYRSTNLAKFFFLQKQE